MFLLLVSCSPVEAVLEGTQSAADSGNTLDLPGSDSDSPETVLLPDSGEADADTDSDADTDADADADTDADTDACQPAIPADVVVFDRSGDSDEDGLSAWVCRNKTLTFSGDRGTIYLHERGDLVTTGTGSTIYAPDDAEVHIHGGVHTVYTTPGAEVFDSSEGTATITTVSCEAIPYDKAAAPADGC